MHAKMLGGGASENNTTGDDELVLFRPTQRKKNSMRRFSDEQIKSLESLFKKENKLEPRKKLEMARELGLHPRQVAIWFQNRRARWKWKQVEQDYTNLKADYDTLSHRFESLKKEKHDLLHQISNLCSQLKEVEGEGEGEGELAGSKQDVDSGSENGELNYSAEQETMAAIYSDEDHDPIRVGSGDHNLLVSDQERHDEKGSNFKFEQLDTLFDESCSNWWNIWS